MGYRRSKEAAQDQVRWEQYLRDCGGLLAEAGVPASVTESRTEWDYSLMHGRSPPADFAVDQLSGRQRALLSDALVEYLRAGLEDPGLGLFGSEEHDAILRRAGVSRAGSHPE